MGFLGFENDIRSIASDKIDADTNLYTDAKFNCKADKTDTCTHTDIDTKLTLTRPVNYLYKIRYRYELKFKRRPN